MDDGDDKARRPTGIGDREGSQPGEIVASPCISVCQLDPIANRCLGCLRSLEEIRDWPFMTNAEKRSLLARLERRRAASS